MSDRTKITIGLALFVIVVTFPIWRGLGAEVPAPPDLPKPKGAARCVEATDWMAAIKGTLKVRGICNDIVTSPFLNRNKERGICS